MIPAIHNARFAFLHHATFPVQMTDFQEAVNVHLSPQLSAAVTMTCYHATTENIFLQDF